MPVAHLVGLQVMVVTGTGKHTRTGVEIQRTYIMHQQFLWGIKLIHEELAKPHTGESVEGVHVQAIR